MLLDKIGFQRPTKGTHTKWLFSDRNLAFYYRRRKTLKSNSLVLKICLSLQKETLHTAEAVWC